jgi:hypothetical protein
VGKPPLNFDYAYGVVVDQLKPLDYEAVRASKVPLRVAITLVDEMRTLVAGDMSSAGELKDALLASAWIPFGGRATASFRGHRAVDGGVLAALPFRLAIDDQCTHVLSLSTRPLPAAQRRLSVLNRYAARRLDALRPGLGDRYITATKQKHADEMWLRQMSVTPSAGRPYVLDLAPLPEAPEVKRHEIRRQHLLAAARSSYEVMFAALEGRSAAALRSGEIQAVPRLVIAEKRDDDPYTRLFDQGSGRSVQWGRKSARPDP